MDSTFGAPGLFPSLGNFQTAVTLTGAEGEELPQPMDDEVVTRVVMSNLKSIFGPGERQETSSLWIFCRDHHPELGVESVAETDEEGDYEEEDDEF